MMEYSILPLGEKALIIRLGTEINVQTHQEVINLLQLLEDSHLLGVTEYVPAYCSITIHYDPVKLWKLVKDFEQSYRSPSQILQALVQQIVEQYKLKRNIVSKLEGKVVEIPVCYGGKYGPDLQEVARYNDLTIEEVIQIHTGSTYLVHMLGFVPGFPYLGGMDTRISMPRKAIPRASIEAGSVGIAGEQTGIYPLSTPGGWRIIGRTPLKLFHPEAKIPTLIQAGDEIKFIPITAEQFDSISSLCWT